MKRMLLLLLLVTGCASEGDGNDNPYGGRVDDVTPQGIEVQWDTDARLALDVIDAAYQQMQDCTGLKAPPPYLVFTQSFDDLGWYYPEYEMAVVQLNSEYPEENSIAILSHELIHHLMFKNDVPDNWNHESILFWCAPFIR